MAGTPSYCEFVESPIRQRAGEMVGLPFDTALWGGSPTVGDATAYDVTNGTMEEADVLIGEPNAVGDVVTFPRVGPLLAGHVYLVQMEVVIGVNTFIPFYRIEVEE
jgi:hypothetical protein